jgi:tRNA(His) 5'-end guanylyltransferase
MATPSTGAWHHKGGRKVQDELGDRMKEYEGAEAGRRLMPLLPALARIDGRSFSTYTRDLARPFDPRLSRLMIETARHLLQEANARLAYVQSDEITLVLAAHDHASQIYFDGRIQKMVSQLAAQATVAFNSLLARHLPEKAHGYGEGTLPTFDCRVWNVPTETEAANAVLWREQDATRNSVESAARVLYSQAELHGKNVEVMRQMMLDKGVDWGTYPAFFQRGTYLQRRTVLRPFTAAEIEQLPPRHNARLHPHLEVERTEYHELDMPRFVTVKNREDVVFRGAEPLL